MDDDDDKRVFIIDEWVSDRLQRMSDMFIAIPENVRDEIIKREDNVVHVAFK